MTTHLTIAGSIVTFLIALAAPVRALEMNYLWANEMVLQADRSVPVWGLGEAGEEIAVTFAGQTKTATVDAGGQWTVSLDAMPASAEGRELRIAASSGTNSYQNVLVGDVWICSGQSNMAEPSMIEATGGTNETLVATNTLVRGYYIPYNIWSPEPQTNNFPGGRISNWHLWQSVTNRTPSVPYYFGKMLQERTGRPVGLILAPVGASAAEAWVPLSSLAADTNFTSFVTQTVSYIENYSNNLAAFEEEYALWLASSNAAASNGVPYTVPAPTKNNRPEFTPKWWGGPLYNSRIAPLRDFGVKGVIWYQGENNAAGQGGVIKTTDGYQRLMAILIDAWRNQLAQPELPFLVVQLSMFNWDSLGTAPLDPNKPGSWSVIREAQELVARVTTNSGLVISADIGERGNIHPLNKRPVGERLARLALRDVYGQSLIAAGPAYVSHAVEGRNIRISFTNTFGGLAIGPRAGVTTNAPVGFAIAGTNQYFFWADAVLTGNEVVVSSPSVTNPVAVRYGYVQYQDVNLYNSEGLPAVPFRTDAWPLVAPAQEDVIEEYDIIKANNTNDLDQAESWVNGTVPGFTNVAVWNYAVTNSKTVKLGTSMGLAGLKIYNPGGKVVITNAVGATNVLTLGQLGIHMANATADVDLGVPVCLSAPQVWEVITNRTLINNGNYNTGGISLDHQGHALTVQGGGNLAFLSRAGTGDLIKKGGSTIRFQSGGTFASTGDVTLMEGNIRVGNRAGSLGLGPSKLTLTGGRLELFSNLAVNYARTTTVAGTAAIYNNNSGNNGAMSYTFGPLSIGEHTLAVAAQGTNAGTVSFGPTQLTGHPTFDVGSRPTNHLRLGAISESGGSFGLTKIGVGSLLITNVCTYTGETVIHEGALYLAGSGGLGSSSSIVVRGMLEVSGVTGGLWTLEAHQRLQGTGTVVGVAAIAGVLAPGDGGIGALRAGTVRWNAGTAWPFELGENSVGDQLVCDGSFLKGSGSGFAFDLQGTGSAGVYTLVTWVVSSDFLNGDLVVTNSPAGLTPLIAVRANDLTLTLAPASGPETNEVVFSSVAFTGNHPHFRWTGRPGRTNRVMGATQLGPEPPANWSNLSAMVVDEAGFAEFIETNPPAPRYYRVLEERP